MTSIAWLPEALQELFTTTADQLARETGAVQRERVITGSRLLQALVFGHLAEPDAPLSQLQRTFCATGAVPISKQALAQHLTEATASFCRAALEAAMCLLFEGAPVAIPLLQRFSAVLVLDSTTITLPAVLADLWAGCGGSSPSAGAAALKVQVRFDLVRGGLDGLELQAGRQHDQTGQVQTAAVPVGALRMADLGYFALEVLAQIVAASGHFLCRPKLQTVLTDAHGRQATVAQYLARNRHGRVDRPVRLGVRHRLPCRLVAQRLPDAVAALRLARLEAAAQREGTHLSAAQRELAHWLVLVTSVPLTLLSFAEALTLYRLRWQVELLFKRWKSAGLQVNQWRTHKPWQVLCLVYSKLLACLVTQWVLVATCWVYADKSLQQAGQALQERALQFLDALQEGVAAIRRVLARLAAIIAGSCSVGRRRSRPPSYHRLLLLTEATLS